MSARLPERAAAGLGAWLADAAPRSARGSVDIALVSDARMRQLNHRFRHVDKATDVLSFPAEVSESASAVTTARRGGRRSSPEPAPQPAAVARPGGDPPALGDIAIALGVARRQAAQQGHRLAVELRVLALHGLLHLLGYDHERDAGQMRRLEARLGRRAGLPVGLIARPSRGGSQS